MNTDEYEGHTPAPWACREDEVYAEGNPCIVALRAHGADGELTSKLPHRWADFALIADAPLLLAEVKRLREGIEKALIPTDKKPWIHPLTKLGDLRDALKELIE